MKKLFIICILIVGIYHPAISQNICGTEPSAEQIRWISDNIDNRLLAAKSNRVENVRIPLKFFIIRRSDGSGGLSESRISSLISQVNQAYSPIGFEFFQSGDIESINSNEFFDLDASQEGALAGSRDVGGIINIYISNTLSSGSSGLCGYTYFPPSADRIFLAQGCVTNGPSTTIHELGHYFSLYHTHGKTNTGTTDELVDGSNCETAGDNVCDTPADPNLSGNVSGCTYTGNAVDANGQTFKPNPSNIMSYAPSNCRNLLTPGQLERAKNGLNAGRSYLNLQYTSFTPRLSVSSFEGCNPYSVTFNDVTSGSVLRRWTFEGGDIETSTAKEVRVTYNSPGVYDVRLQVTNQAGQIREILREDYIAVSNVFKDTVLTTNTYDFNDGTFPFKWDIFNNDRLETFKMYNKNSLNSLVIEHFNYKPIQQPAIDDLELDNLSKSETRSYTLSFDVSYKSKPASLESNTIDSLLVGFKTNCNNNFKMLSIISGEEMSYDTTSAYYELTSDSEWKKFTFDFKLDDLGLTSSNLVVVPTIRSLGYGNNNIYIDNIEIIPDFSVEKPSFFRTSDVTAEYIELRWANNSNNIRNTIIERSFDGENWEEIGRKQIDDNIYRDSVKIEETGELFYRIFARNSASVSDYSDIVQVRAEVLNINDRLMDKINFYPNPFYNEFTLENLPENSVITVNSLEGKMLLKEENKNKTTLQLNGLNEINSGLYILKVTNPSLNGFKTFTILKN